MPIGKQKDPVFLRMSFIMRIFAECDRERGLKELPFFMVTGLIRIMDRTLLQEVIERAARERALSVVALDYDEDDNVIEVTLDRQVPPVSLEDCESVHRAVLAEFDRDVEDYSLTVSSKGISGAEADEMLKTIE